MRLQMARHTVMVQAQTVVRSQRTMLLQEQKKSLQLEQIIRVSDPAHNLRLGYSLSYGADGVLVRSVQAVTAGQVVRTTLVDGSFTSVVKTIE